MYHGPAFGEHIKTEKIKHHKYDDDYHAPFKMRGIVMPVLMVLVTVILLFKVFSLQIIHGADYRALADSNRIRTQIVHAPRGIILDRNGTPLVFNVPGFRQVTKNASKSGEEKSVHISKDQALDMIAQGSHNVEVDSLRQYPYKDAMSHVLGYTGQITKEDLDAPEFENYQTTDWIGKNGIEGQYEHLLRGQDGKQLIEVDALGQKVRSLGTTDPISGKDITLTIDAKLQLATYEAAKDVKKGAVIVSTPDGQILAMVSKPSFDPNLFTLDETYKVATTSGYQTLASILLDGTNQPLLDRAIGGLYPPGSTFKLLTSIAGLQNNLIDKNYKVADTGVLKVGEFSYANWYYTQYGKTEEGDLDVIRALARSNDIFFYKLAALIDVPKLSETARNFGVGQKLGIDIAGEAKGLLPSKEWKQKQIGESWYLGDTFHLGIGQGYLLTTPLQVNAWSVAIANGGILYQPRLFKDKPAVVLKKNTLSQQTLDLVHKGMVDACREGSGVAWPLYHLRVKNPKLKVDGKNILSVASTSADMREIPIACKTGTSQHGGEDTLPHAWITAYAPLSKPQIVVTVLSESSGEGSSIAGPIAKKVFEAYFKNKH